MNKIERPRCLAAVTPLVHDKFLTPAHLAELEECTDFKAVIREQWTQEEFRSLLLDFKPEILVTGWHSPKLTEDLCREAVSVKALFHTAGTVRGTVDRFFIDQGGLVTNWGNTMAPSVAEGTFMMILASLRRVPHFHELMHHEQGWKKDDGKEICEGLFRRNVGLHGFGVISRALVDLMAPFNCRVSTYSPHVPDELLAQYNVHRCESLEELHAENHIVVNLASKIPANYHIINADILSRLHDGAHYILTGRGATVDTDALVAELKSGRIFAALDVFEPEQLPKDSPLRGLRNCLLIPCMAGPTPDCYSLMGEVVADNVRNYLAGKPLINPVAAKKYDLMT